MVRHVFRLSLVMVVALFAAGCASTSLREQWFDPSYRGGPFKVFLVLAVGDGFTGRRVFEDAMVGRLAAGGAQAVPSYRYLPGRGMASEIEIDGAVRQAGADALLMTRARGISQQVQLSTVMVPGPGSAFGPGWYGWYSAWYPMQEVMLYEIAIVETSVFATATGTLVWTGVTETFNPRSAQREAPGFAEVIVTALAVRGLLPAPK